MVKRILNYNIEEDRNILRKESEDIDINNIDEIKDLVQDLKDTLHSIPDAKGLSAIQIGIPKRICICSWAGEEVLLINPKIIRVRGQQEFLEGCLSVPGIYKKITRFQKVWCSYVDENGQQKEIAEGGRMSNIIQHELDHFKGKCSLYDEGELKNDIKEKE